MSISLVALTSVGTIIVAVVAIALGAGLDIFQHPTPAFTIAQTTLQIAMICGVVFGWARRRGRRPADLGLSGWSWRWAVIAVVVAILVRLIVIGLGALGSALGYQPTNPQLAFLLLPNLSWPLVAVMLLLFGIGVPFAEESFFRGVLYTWLRERWGVSVGVIVSAVVFGVIHGVPWLIISTIPLGIAAALVYERSRTLWAPVVVHAIFNLSGLLMIYIIQALGINLSGMP
jgi:membrane protease YdiL (CAAX protease family)